MRILITNDDSINAFGLKELVDLAKKYGDVVVVAPEYEQSGKSHGINIHRGIQLKAVDIGLGVPAYSVDSTPADCVRIAYYGMKLDFDLVFSGINSGLNMGEDIFYSGTCAAVSEAAFINKAALAFSTYPNRQGDLRPWFDRVMDYMLAEDLLKAGRIYNINVPNNPQGLKITFQGKTYYDIEFVLREGLYYQEGEHHYERDQDNHGSDVWAVFNNYISITPLKADRTDHDLMRKL
ncbi:MAG: 5'/3'-nucleotidase SurE, partial [Acholeplasmataceae bacterium]|nr:5'/3'-nucleotidase SurE [Acholeplasmataceae bacterium]